MSTSYKFKDRQWNVSHRKTGEHLGTVSVSSDSTRERYASDKSTPPESHVDELLNNQLWNFLDTHKLQPADIDVDEVVDKPRKRVAQKSQGGSSCW